MIHRKGSRNMKYKKISHEQRAHVIKELTENGKTLKEVSEETQLKPSTVKAILQVYMKEGRIGKKSTRDRKVKLLNTSVLAIVDGEKMSYDTQLGFLTSYVRVNQIQSDISHNGQTFAETQEKLDQYSRMLVSQQIKEFLRDKKSEIMDQLKNPQARANFMNQLTLLDQEEIQPKQLGGEVLMADEEQLVERIQKRLFSQYQSKQI